MTRLSGARLAPFLDEAMGQLGGRDRDAIVLRYFERLDMRGVGSVLTFFFEASWAHIVGVPALLAFVGLAFVALAAQVADA